MTRFARAKGSKASNERLPEEATSWQEMKQQLLDKRKRSQDDDARQANDQKKLKAYRAYLEEKEKEQSGSAQWADFPRIKPKAKTTIKVEAVDNDAPLEVSSKVRTKTFKAKMKIKKKPVLAKKIKTETSSLVDIKKDKKPVGRVIKKAKQEANKDSKPPVQERTEDDLRKIEKKKQRRIKQIVKKKEMKAKLKEQETTNSNVTPKIITNAKPAPKGPKVKPNGPPKSKIKDLKRTDIKRKKPLGPKKILVNGKELQLDYFDGFPVKREDGIRLRALKKEMISKGLPKSQINAALQLERRRAEKALCREKRKVCFQCRMSGHNIAECPEVSKDQKDQLTNGGICYKCGSTEHTHFRCKVVKGHEYKFATCFICKEQGHISKQCPDNARGIYPKGGACKVCGDVTHLMKDCPQHQAQQQSISNEIKVETLNGDNPDVMEVKNEKRRNVRRMPKKKIVKLA